jgi:hypothetical protein
VNNEILDKIYHFKLKTQPPQLLRIDKVKKKIQKMYVLFIFFEILVEIKFKTKPLFG